MKSSIAVHSLVFSIRYHEPVPPEYKKQIGTSRALP